MIEIDDAVVWDKENALNKALQGNPLWPHSVAIRYDFMNQNLYLAPTCDFPARSDEYEDDYLACYTRPIFHIDIKLVHTMKFKNYKKMFDKINYGGTSIYLHISNTSDTRRYYPIIKNSLVMPTIEYFENKFDKLYVELSNKTWNSKQFHSFRYITKADKPNWYKLLRKKKKIQEFAIMEETPKKPHDINPIPGFKLESTALMFKQNNNLVDIFKY